MKTKLNDFILYELEKKWPTFNDKHSAKNKIDSVNNDPLRKIKMSKKVEHCQILRNSFLSYNRFSVLEDKDSNIELDKEALVNQLNTHVEYCDQKKDAKNAQHCAKNVKQDYKCKIITKAVHDDVISEKQVHQNMAKDDMVGTGANFSSSTCSFCFVKHFPYKKFCRWAMNQKRF